MLTRNHAEIYVVPGVQMRYQRAPKLRIQLLLDLHLLYGFPIVSMAERTHEPGLDLHSEASWATPIASRFAYCYRGRAIRDIDDRSWNQFLGHVGWLLSLSMMSYLCDFHQCKYIAEKPGCSHNLQSADFPDEKSEAEGDWNESLVPFAPDLSP